MKKIHILAIGAIFGITAILSSCSSSSDTTPPDTTGPTAKMNFKKDFHSQYDIFVVDSADASGNNGDRILGSTRVSAPEIIVDTALSFMGKTNVVRIVTFMTPPALNDTNYFYQDPNGDLYRYNYGFSILNQFSYLVQAIGSPVDVGWVLAAKMTSKEGTTWVAKTDSVLIQQFNIPVYLTSQATMLSDTTFLVDTSHVKARHVQHIITAKAGNGVAQDGKVIIDSYLSTDINAVVEDFFRHVKLSGQLLNAQAQGKLKIMTSYGK